ncbi:S-adenosyl-L-methionine-dependent methyltransferase, partial [Chlamydoabsidia padenii]
MPPAETQSLESSNEQGKPGSTMIGGRGFHTTDSTYWLPNDDIENQRLNKQHMAIKALFNGTNFNPKVQEYVNMKNPNTKILDCGCGPGTWIMDVASEEPNCQYYGVDISDVFPKVGVPSNIHFQVANVLEGLPFEDNTFDFISLRLLILAFRKEEWIIALKELYRVLKPGGFIESKDCGQTMGGNEFVRDMMERLVTFMENRGQVPYANLGISGYLSNIGFEVVESDAKRSYFGRTDPVNQANSSNMLQFYKTLQPYLAEPFDLKTDEKYEAYMQRLAVEIRKEPEAYWPLTATLARKPL